MSCAFVCEHECNCEKQNLLAGCCSPQAECTITYTLPHMLFSSSSVHEREREMKNSVKVTDFAIVCVDVRRKVKGTVQTRLKAAKGEMLSHS